MSTHHLILKARATTTYRAARLRFRPPDDGTRLGFLLKPPRPEGYGYEEMAGAGYERSLLLLEPYRSGLWINAESLVISQPIEGWPAIGWGALFTKDRELWSYAPLMVKRSIRPDDTLVFERGTIEVDWR